MSAAAASVPHIDLRWTRLTRDQVTAVVDQVLLQSAAVKEMHICREDLVQEKIFIFLFIQSLLNHFWEFVFFFDLSFPIQGTVNK